MVKIIFTIIIVINVFAYARANDDLIQILDSIIGPLVPIGMADTLLVEDGEKLKKMCGMVNKDFMNKTRDKVPSLVKGLTARFMERGLDKFSADKVAICQLTNKNELDKATAMAKEYNKHGAEANKIRLSFLTALDELTQKPSKSSFPTLLCLVNQVSDKFLGIYPDKDGAKDFVRTMNELVFKDIFVSGLESEGFKAVESCPMPEPKSNHKYNSVLVAIFHAIVNLQDK